MADNEPVGARAGRAFRRMRDFFTADENMRPQDTGAYTTMPESDIKDSADAMRMMQEREAARAARAAAPPTPSRITNRPVGGNLAAAQPSRRMDLPTGPEMDVMLPRSVGPDNMAMERPPAPAPARQRPASRPRSRAATPRQAEADRLNEISLAFARGERPRGGAADTIGRAMGIEGYKKGGMIGKKPVKKAAGGTVPKPKVPGRSAGRPATTVKAMGTRSMAKAAAPKKPVAMPAFKKGGKVSMKGKRK